MWEIQTERNGANSTCLGKQLLYWNQHPNSLPMGRIQKSYRSWRLGPHWILLGTCFTVLFKSETYGGRKSSQQGVNRSVEVPTIRPRSKKVARSLTKGPREMPATTGLFCECHLMLDIVGYLHYGLFFTAIYDVISVTGTNKGN